MDVSSRLNEMMTKCDTNSEDYEPYFQLHEEYIQLFRRDDFTVKHSDSILSFVRFAIDKSSVMQQVIKDDFRSEKFYQIFDVIHLLVDDVIVSFAKLLEYLNTIDSDEELSLDEVRSDTSETSETNTMQEKLSESMQEVDSTSYCMYMSEDTSVTGNVEVESTKKVIFTKELLVELFKELLEKIPELMVNSKMTPTPHVLISYSDFRNWTNCFAYNPQLMELFISSGYDLNTKDKEGYTILHAMKERIQKDTRLDLDFKKVARVIELFLENGAYLCARNNNKDTIFSYSYWQIPPIIEVFKKYSYFLSLPEMNINGHDVRILMWQMIQQANNWNSHKNSTIIENGEKITYLLTAFHKYITFPSLKRLTALKIKDTNDLYYQQILPEPLVRFVDLH